MSFLHFDEQASAPGVDYEAIRRGKNRERMFLHAWRSSLHSHLWLRNVREANEKEDCFGHIDAFLMLAGGREIPIQIKGTYESARTFAKMWDPEKRGIVIVVLGDDYSTEEVIFATLFSLEKAWKRLKLDGALVHEFKVWRFLETWKNPSSPPAWFHEARESMPEEKTKLGCDAFLRRIDGHELPIHVVHNIKGLRSIPLLEGRSGIPRVAVIVCASSIKTEIEETTKSAVDAMKMRFDERLRLGLKRESLKKG